MSRMLKIAALLALAAAAGLALLWWTCPDVRPLKDASCNLTIQVRDWKGRFHPFRVGPASGHWLSLRHVSPYLRAAVVVGEDAKFYRHKGFDLEALRDAALKDLEERRFVRGGSTITQQVAKNLYLSREKTLTRKLREAVIAYRLERTLSKRRILELYLNVVELGPDVYGAESGARFYFGKSARGLNPKEAAFLAAMLPGPKVYNPYKNLRRVERRSRLILRRMMQAGFLDRSSYQAWRTAALNIRGLERKIESITGEKEETAIPPAEVREPEGDQEAPELSPPEGVAPAPPEEGAGVAEPPLGEVAPDAEAAHPGQ